MLSCKNITELASTRLDSEISWHQKIEFSLHLMVCKRCRTYANQLKLLQKAFKLLHEKKTNVFLSDQARQRIKMLLNNSNPEIK